MHSNFERVLIVVSLGKAASAEVARKDDHLFVCFDDLLELNPRHRDISEDQRLPLHKGEKVIGPSFQCFIRCQVHLIIGEVTALETLSDRKCR